MNDPPAHLRQNLEAALAGFAGEASPGAGARALLGVLGYASERRVEVGGVEAFIALLEEGRPLTKQQRQLLGRWRSVDIVFQITGEEIGENPGLFRDFDQGRARSFLFVAADLDGRAWSRGELAEMTRAANRGFLMPVVLLFRHGGALTLAVVHRRTHKRDSSRDVLEKVTLVKDVRLTGAHRAHLDILAGLALPRLVAEEGVRNFDELHAAWERALDIEALNRRFYGELFAWFERAVARCRFPDDGAGPGNAERHVIRLVTRLLFIWFLKEKGLVPDELFTEDFARRALKRHTSESGDYYRACLQNLFFATLNTGIERRGFSEGSPATHRDFNLYRYRRLLADPDDFVARLKSVPFVNGGLFDCLDDFEGKRAGGRRIDAFTDNEAQGRDLHVPASLFFHDGEGLIPLLRRYKFTVEENTPLDREVALDPELLGRAFENLLAAYNPETRATARKATGSYYTPRHIVDYMVGEALAAALAAKVAPADGDVPFQREKLGYLLDWEDACGDAGELFDADETRALVGAIAELRVLDPAAGSGAFPMGVLHRLTLALGRLDPENEIWEALQKKRATAQAGKAFDVEKREARDEELAEISRLFEAYRDSDFGRSGTFDATVRPLVVLARKSAAGETLRAATVRGGENAAAPAAFMEKHGFAMAAADLVDSGWALAEPALLALRRKIEAAGTPLRDYLKKGLYRGVTTGLNEAFVIDAATRERLTAEDPASADLIRPWLRGRDVRRWRADWRGLSIIFTRRGTDIALYPAIERHLSRWRADLEPKPRRGARRGRKPGSYKWFEIQDNTAYHEAFARPKIVYPDIGTKMRALLDREGHMTGNTCYIVPGGDACLLAILNSKLLDVWFRLSLSCLDDPFDGGDMRFIGADMQHAPIAPAPPATARRLATLAETIQTARQADPTADTQALEQEIDETVFTLYGLDKADIATIEVALHR